MSAFSPAERIPEADAWGGAILDGRDLDMEGYSRCARRFMGGEYRRFVRFLVDKLGLDSEGRVLEVGPGPGWIGIWLAKQQPGLEVVGLELSPDMIRVAEKNRVAEAVTNVTYVEGNAAQMPFADNSFDAVFSNGSLHHWIDPVVVFDEIARVTKPAGRFAVQDGRRDIGMAGWMVYHVFSNLTLLDRSVPAGMMKRGWRTSIQAGYTPQELQALLVRSTLKGWSLGSGLMDLLVHSIPGG